MEVIIRVYQLIYDRVFVFFFPASNFGFMFLSFHVCSSCGSVWISRTSIPLASQGENLHKI